MTDNQIITGQYVRIEQTPAKTSQRFAGFIIDLVIQVAYAMFWLFTDDYLDLHMGRVAFVLLVVLPIILYQPVSETLAGGQTLSKFLLKTRVVSVDGSQPSVGSFLLRWLIMPIDVMFFGSVAAFSMLVTPRRQRLGDLAAGTMVIKLNSYEKIRVHLDEYAFVRDGYQPTYTEARQLDEQQATHIARTLADRSTSRQNRIEQLSLGMCRQLKLTAPAPSLHEWFLATLLSDYRYFEMNNEL